MAAPAERMRSMRERRPLSQAGGGPALTHADHSDGPAFGVYIHWPFCLSKCPYCDFNSHVRHAEIDQGRFVRAFAAEIAATAARAPRPHRLQHLPRRRNALAHRAQDRRRHSGCRCPELAGRARCRGHARSQSVERRGDAVCRLSRCRSEPGLYRRPGIGRCGAASARASAFGVRSARSGRGRALRVRSLFARSHLCASGADAGCLGERACARHCASGRAPLALSARRRARHAFPPPACGGQADHAGRGHRAHALRRHADDLRGCRPSRLRSLEPRTGGGRMPAQSRLLACDEYYGIGPGAHGRLEIDGTRHAVATEKRPEA